MKKKVVIIGSGFGGLSAAALLAKDGFEVTVLEKHDQVGGKARLFEVGGFSFDMGPSWYLMPEIFEGFFERFNKKPTDYYDLKRLDPGYRMHYKDGTIVDIPADVEKVHELFGELEEGGKEQLREYLKVTKYQYDVAVEEFLYKRYTSIFDFFNGKMVFEGAKLKVFQNVQKFISSYFKEDVAQNILKYNMVFIGADPRKAPAIYALMSYVDLVLGVWYPQGGLNGVARGMQRLAEEQGVRFIFNADVEKIITKDGVAIGVEANGKKYEADVVVSNADYHHTETKLLDRKDQSYPEEYWDKKVMAPTGFILYLGVGKKIKNLEHHTVVLHKDMNQSFDEVFVDPKWPDDPSYYVCAPSKNDPAAAPEGKENLFVLVPVATDLEDPDDFREAFADKVIADIEKITGESFAEDIEVRKIYSRKDFAKDYYALKGSALGLSHTLFQTALFRPDMQSRKIPNLYYTGQFTHPGIGVPMVIISSEIIAEEIKNTHAQ